VGAFGNLILGEAEAVGVSDGSSRKSDGGCDHCVISNHSAVICRRMSPMLKSIGVVTLEQIWRGKGNVGRCKPNLIRSASDMGLSYVKENVSISSAV